MQKDDKIDDEIIDGYLFCTYDGTNYLLGYAGNETELTLPENYNGESYQIYKYAFFNCKDLKSIIIPDSVTTIGNGSFKDCNKLTSITIPSSITKIGACAFSGCSSLKNITLPNNIMSIGNYAFYHCTDLTSVIIPDSVKVIGKWAFYGCQGLTKIYYAGDIAGWCEIRGLNNLRSAFRTLYIDGKKLRGNWFFRNT